jgi:hypothetical protein
MPALPATRRFSALGSFVIKCRLATLTAYGGSLVLFHHAEFLAQEVYNDLCSREGIRFAKPTSVMNLILVMVVFCIPVLLARSRTLIVTNLAASLITAGCAVLLLFTALNTPYECFTMGGDYEDHASGLPEFILWSIFVLLSSFALLFIDLFVWALKKVTARSE